MVQKDSLIMYDGIIVLGATATGKTKISIDLAKALNTEIINADSMYIYKDLSIGTAKPTIEEMNGVKHHIIDVAEPSQDFNVINYRDIAKSVIFDFKSKNLIPIIVGGTGFYIDSLTKNYSYGNATHSDEIRAQLNQELLEYGNEHLYNKLMDLSPKTASKLHPNDKTRVIRALEILMLTGKSQIENNNDEEILIKNPLFIGLNINREILYDRINQRVDIMINNGLVEEVKNLYNRGFKPEIHQSMKGIGYKEICEYLEGSCLLDEAIDKIKQHTRNYAKRQITWFKRNDQIHWFNPLEDKNIIDQIVKLYKN